MRTKRTGYLMLALAVFLSAVMPIAYKSGDSVNPVSFSFYISMVGLLGSGAIMLAKGTYGEIVDYFTDREHMVIMLVVSVLFALQILIFSYTTHYISASLLAVIYRSWPLILVLIAPALLKEKVSKWGVAAVAVGLLGTAVTLVGGTTISISAIAVPFVGMVFLAAVFDALETGMQKRYHYELTSSLFIYNLVAFFIFLALALYYGTLGGGSLGLADLGSVVFLGLFQNVFLTFIFIMAFRSTKTSVASSAFMLTPFVTMVLDYFLLGEPIIPAYVVIALSVVLGLVIERRSPKGSTYIYYTADDDDETPMPAIYDVTSAFLGTKSESVYDAMRGRGRVLAFYKRMGKVSPNLPQYLRLIDSVNPRSEECQLYTNARRNPNIHQDQLDSVRGITKHDKYDLLVIGVGDPWIVEKKFAELHTGFWKEIDYENRFLPVRISDSTAVHRHIFRKKAQ